MKKYMIMFVAAISLTGCGTDDDPIYIEPSVTTMPCRTNPILINSLSGKYNTASELNALLNVICGDN